MGKKIPITQDIRISSPSTVTVEIAFCAAPSITNFVATARPLFSKAYPLLNHALGNSFLNDSVYRGSFYSPKTGDLLRSLFAGNITVGGNPPVIFEDQKYWSTTARPLLPLSATYSAQNQTITLTIPFGSSYNGQLEYEQGASPRQYSYSIKAVSQQSFDIVSGKIIINLPSVEDAGADFDVCDVNVSGGDSAGPQPNPGGSF